MAKGKRSYTPRTTADGATEHMVKATAAPSASEKQEIAQLLLETNVQSLFETRDGACRIKQLPGLIGQYLSSFGECDECSCSLTRRRTAEPRKLFRHTIVERELRRVAFHDGASPPIVRAVSIGCGGLLTEFECLLELWWRGCTVETFIAIDPCYSEHSAGHTSYMESLAALARFFAPHCRVFSFSSCDDYLAAARCQPDRYGRATLFLRCDARSVEEAQYKDVAATALQPGCCSYELWNGGNEVRARPPLEKQLPQRLRTELTSVYDRTWYYSLGVLRRREGASTGATGSADRWPPSGFGASLLEDVSDACRFVTREHSFGKRLMAEAARWLASTARHRAAQHGKRVFKVVCNGPLPVHDAPSRDAKVVGTRAMGDETIADEVRLDGWVCISRLLDTREGYELYDMEREQGTRYTVQGTTTTRPCSLEREHQQAWMPTHDADGGELLREMELDQDPDVDEEPDEEPLHEPLPGEEMQIAQ